MNVDLGYGEMWESFYEQADREGWPEEKRRRIAKVITEGISAEIDELAESGVLEK